VGVRPADPKAAANILPLEANASAALSLPVLGFTLGPLDADRPHHGLVPAWQSSHADLVDGLKEGGRGSSGSIRQQRFRKILVGAQVALSVTLLAGAALLIVSFIRLSQQEPGFNPTNLWVGGITLPQAQYPDQGARTRFAEQTLSALQAIPGFENVSVSSNVPLANGGGATLYARGDREVPPVAQRRGAPSHDVTPGWFRTWGIPLLAGRDFNEHDIADRRTSPSSARAERRRFSATKIRSAKRCSSRAGACRSRSSASSQTSAPCSSRSTTRWNSTAHGRRKTSRSSR
jgi:hypothetical protein